MTIAALTLLAGASHALGAIALRRLTWPELRRYEAAALRLTAGLGLTALLLSVLALTGWFSYATPTLIMLTAIGAVLAARDAMHQPRIPSPESRVPSPESRVPSPESRVPSPESRVPSPEFRVPSPESRVPSPESRAWSRSVFAAVMVSAVLACLGAIAPVTDDDALAFVVPSARHIAETGALRVWTDQARSMWPQSQQVLLAYVLRLGGDRLGAVTALEWLLCIGVVSALARRVCERSEHVGPALVIALGSPVVAFQVASGKEDLLLLATGGAAAFCLAGSGSVAELGAAGMFAGLAAGAKYPGLGIAAAAVVWTANGQHENRLRSAAIVAACAAAAGGLWYGLNMWRFANPVAPFVGGARGTHFDAELVRAFNDAFGAGRGPIAFLMAPLRIFIEPSLFCGRGNLYNPLAYAGLAGLFVPAARRGGGVLFFIAAVLYVGWFLNLQNARLLLPAAVLLAPAAADRVMPIVRSRPLWRALGWGAMAVSLGVVAAVGAVRAVRYARDPATYLARETQRYEDIAWMNAHLDPARHRVGSTTKVLGYLEVPSLVLDATRQLEIGTADLESADRLLAACRRQRITHVFGARGDFDAIRPSLRLVYENPASRLGGVRFFREPPTEATAVFEIVP